MNGWMVSPLGTGMSGSCDLNLEASGTLENPALHMYKEHGFLRQSQPLLWNMVNFMMWYILGDHPNAIQKCSLKLFEF